MRYLQVVKSIETESRKGVTMSWGEGNKESVFNGDRVSV
jgi:hypothetical protein